MKVWKIREWLKDWGVVSLIGAVLVALLIALMVETSGTLAIDFHLGEVDNVRLATQTVKVNTQTMNRIMGRW